MTVTAFAVMAAALATIVVISGVIYERAETGVAAPTGAAAATFATRLASMPRLMTLSSAQSGCRDCATIEAIQPAGSPLSDAAQWLISIRMHDGTQRMLAAESQPSWHAGDQVRVIDGVPIPM